MLGFPGVAKDTLLVASMCVGVMWFELSVGIPLCCVLPTCVRCAATTVSAAAFAACAAGSS